MALMFPIGPFLKWIRRAAPFPPAAHPEQATPPAPPSNARPAFARLPGEEQVGSMTTDELSAWENRDVPSLGRDTDTVEARADEKQDATTSLNFTLHWTSPEQSWRYPLIFPLRAICSVRVRTTSYWILRPGPVGRPSSSTASAYERFRSICRSK